MSTIRSEKYELNAQGNANFSIANSWSAVIKTSDTVRLEARANGDVVIPSRLVLQAPNGTLYAVTVNNTGSLITTVTT